MTSDHIFWMIGTTEQLELDTTTARMSESQWQLVWPELLFLDHTSSSSWDVETGS
jgi:hypothetical protein